MNRWLGKVAVVTGASSGIGAAIAELLVKEGMQVVGFDFRMEGMEELSIRLRSEKGKLHPIKVDVAKEEEVVEGFDWIKRNLGPVNILVNCAGVGGYTSLIHDDTNKWKKCLDTNLLGLCITTREAIRDMRSNSVDGHVVHINSILGHMIPTNIGSVTSIYVASKHAVTALTETIRQELNTNKHRIKITSISPGIVNTPMLKNSDLPRDVLDAFKGQPLLIAEDIAEAVRYVIATPPHVQVHELTVRAVNGI